MWLAGVSWETLRPTSYWSGPFGATNKMYTSHTQTAQDRSLIPAMTSLVMGQGSLAKNGKFVCDPEKLPHMNVT